MVATGAVMLIFLVILGIHLVIMLTVEIIHIEVNARSNLKRLF